MKKMILISGQAQHGKDTVATILSTLLETKGYKVLITHYGDLLKYICKTYFGWNGEKDEEGRTLLQHVGTQVVRKQDPNFWVDFLVRFLKTSENNWDYVIVSDTRFPNEITKMKEAQFDVIHVKVIRPNFDNGLTIDQQQHESERALETITPDYIIDNSETVSHLIQNVCDFLVFALARTVKKKKGRQVDTLHNDTSKNFRKKLMVFSRNIIKMIEL